MKQRANLDIALLVLRLALGAVLIWHGGLKLGVLPGGTGPASVIENVAAMGFHPALVWAWLLIIGELAAGLGILLGLLTPLASLGVAGLMGVAFWKVHLPTGLLAGGQHPGFEQALALFAMSVCLLFAGPGRVSADFLLFARKAGKPALR